MIGQKRTIHPPYVKRDTDHGHRVYAAAVNPTDITFRAGGRAAQLAARPAPYVPAWTQPVS